MITTTALVEEALTSGDQLEQIIKLKRPDVYETLFGIIDPKKRYSESDLVTLRTRQAKDIGTHIIDLYQNIQANLIVLGFVLIQGDLLESYKLLGPDYDSMLEWAYDQDIPKTTCEHALLLGKVWPYLKELQLDLDVLADERFSQVKAKHVLHMSRDATRQKKAITDKITEAHILALAEEDDDGEREGGTPPTLAPDVERAIRQQADREYRANARAEIMMTLEQKDADVIYNEQRSRGEKEKPKIPIRLSYHHGTCQVLTSSFPCTPEHIESLKRNQYEFYFLLEHEPTALSVRALGEKLEERSIIELDNESVESF